MSVRALMGAVVGLVVIVGGAHAPQGMPGALHGGSAGRQAARGEGREE